MHKHMMFVEVVSAEEVSSFIDRFIVVSERPIDADVIWAEVASHSNEGISFGVDEIRSISEEEMAEMVKIADHEDACFIDDRIIIVDVDADVCIEHHAGAVMEVDKMFRFAKAVR